MTTRTSYTQLFAVSTLKNGNDRRKWYVWLFMPLQLNLFVCFVVQICTKQFTVGWWFCIILSNLLNSYCTVNSLKHLGVVVSLYSIFNGYVFIELFSRIHAVKLQIGLQNRIFITWLITSGKKRKLIHRICLLCVPSYNLSGVCVIT